MNDKLLSILIPVYNAQMFINRCLGSIVKQKGYNESVEIVIINDGSKDSSLSILQDYQARYKNINIISRENKGIGPTRNELIDNAKGKFFWFIDADDYVSIESLSILLPLLDSDRYDMILMSYNWLTGETSKTITYAGEYEQAVDFTNKSIYNNSLWTRVYRTSVVKDNGIRLNPYIMGEDFDFIFKLTPLLGRVKCIELPLYYYVFNPASAVGSVNLEHRIKVSEDSVRCIISNTEYLRPFPSHNKTALKKHLDNFVLGYLHALYRVNFSFSYKKEVFKRLSRAGVLPIKSEDGNYKHAIFVKVVNNKCLRMMSLIANCIALKIHDSANMKK